MGASEAGDATPTSTAARNGGEGGGRSGGGVVVRSASTTAAQPPARAHNGGPRRLQLHENSSKFLESPAVVRYEPSNVSAGEFGVYPPESSSNGIALEIEQPGAAILLRGPRQPGNGSRIAASNGRPEAELLMFATNISLMRGQQNALTRAPPCSDLFSAARCAQISSSDNQTQVAGGGPHQPLSRAGLVVAGDVVVTGRTMSPTIDALLAELDKLQSRARKAEATLQGLRVSLHEETARSDLSMARVIGSRAEAAAANVGCQLEINTVPGGSPVITDFDGSAAGSILARGWMNARDMKNTGLPLSALFGVPEGWVVGGIRAHAAVMVTVPEAAAFGGVGRPRKFAFLYVTGGATHRPCHRHFIREATPCEPEDVKLLNKAFRLDMVSLRWERLPDLPHARAGHGLAWMPLLGVVIAGPGFEDGDFEKARPLLESGGNGVKFQALAVPEAFDASREWSRPIQVKAGAGGNLTMSFSVLSAGVGSVANRALLVEPSSTAGRAKALPGGRRVGQTIVTQTAWTRANAAKPGPERPDRGMGWSCGA